MRSAVLVMFAMLSAVAAHARTTFHSQMLTLGGASVFVTAANGRGDFAGAFQQGLGAAGFYYHKGTLTTLPPSPVSCNMSSFDCFALPDSLNWGSQLAGTISGLGGNYPDRQYVHYIFTWRPGETTLSNFTLLDPLDCELSCSGVFVNSNGALAYTVAKSSFIAYFGTAASAQPIPGLGDNSVVTGLNNGGAVVGTTSSADGIGQFFLYHHGKLRLFRPSGTSKLGAVTINGGNSIAGNYTALDGSNRIFIFDHNKYTTASLSPTSSRNVTLYGMNSHGTVVGTYVGSNTTGSAETIVPFIFNKKALTPIAPPLPTGTNSNFVLRKISMTIDDRSRITYSWFVSNLLAPIGTYWILCRGTAC